LYSTDDGCRQGERFTVDTDRYLAALGVDDDFARRQHGKAAAASAAEQTGGLRRAVHGDGQDAEDARVQPLAASESRRVAALVRVVADEDGLRSFDEHVAGADAQARPLVVGQQFGE
jgi:hypothetical protein